MFDHLPHKKSESSLWASCVYAIVNTIDNRLYIGSSIRPRVRVTMHFTLLRKNLHKNKKLQSDYNRHGEKSFRVDILKTIQAENPHSMQRPILNEERCFIEILHPYYNIKNINYHSK